MTKNIAEGKETTGQYCALKQRLARGWNTWNTNSVLSHVLLPAGIALNFGIKEYTGGAFLHDALIGRQGDEVERIHPGPRTFDGAYTELLVQWKGIELLVQTAVEDEQLFVLVTPQSTGQQLRTPLLIVEIGLLWNRPGIIRHDEQMLYAESGTVKVGVYAIGKHTEDPNIPVQTPYMALQLDGEVGVSTASVRSLEVIKEIILRQRTNWLAYCERYGDLTDVYLAMQGCLAWNTIYDPLNDRVITPVSRIWNVNSGGYSLFCWDTYFAAAIASLDNKDLAYANAIEITRQKTKAGFVPNYSTAAGTVSQDRSQPPVGALIVQMIFQRYGEKWILEELFDDLLAWNRWWLAHRMYEGLLCWGSDPYQPVTGNYWESHGINERAGAVLESGLDNSPMYDDIPFDDQLHLLRHVDVGLNALYVRDCTALADIALALGRKEAPELRLRAAEITKQMQSLWDDSSGIYRNRRTDTDELCAHLSPTNFYPLLSSIATHTQAERMINEHLLNTEEFWGEWIMPSIARNDPAFMDNTYWRGRIWAPMNFLVYLGVRSYGLPQVAADFAAKSAALLRKEWHEHEHGHVHENYNANTGEGCDVENSDRFYHWGGLLGLITFIDAGYFDQSGSE